MKGKKGQLGGLQMAIVTLILVTALIAVGFMILQEFMQNDQFYEADAVVNETEAWINTTGYTVDGEFTDVEKTRDFVLTAIWDEDSGAYNVSVPLANATITSNTGVVTNATATTYDNVSLSYTYEEGTQGWTGLFTTVEAFNTVPTLLALIILVIMIGIVLAVIFNVMPGARVAGA